MSSSESTTAPERLRTQVLAEWAPVAPMASPPRRAARLAPLALVVGVIAALFWGRPEDGGPGTMAIIWALSAGQWAVGLWLLSLAFREAVPGRALDRGVLIAAIGVTVLVLGVNLGAKDLLRGTEIPAGREWRYWLLCVRWPLVLSSPLVVLASLLATRALPLRPALAGSLTGLAAAVVTDAGWRLGCEVSAPGHVIGAHWLAIGVMTAAGALLSVLTDRWRWR
jgi:hypothetical protein